jgi:hypothetical protein
MALCAQKAQSKKGKAAEKSPQDEQPSSAVGSGVTADLDNQIIAQGDKVRELKTKKAPKVRAFFLCFIL